MLAICFIHNTQNSFYIFCTTGLRFTVWGPNILPNCRYNNKTSRVYGNKFLSLFSRKVCPRGLRRGSAVARLLGLRVRIRSGTWMSFFGGGECCVCPGRGLCVRLISRPEGFYWVWCVWVWTWGLMRSWTMTGSCVAEKIHKRSQDTHY